MLDTCKNILEKYITSSFNYSVKHMMNFTLLTCVLLSFSAHIWYILWLKIPRITSDMQNDASTYWTFTYDILSSFPILSLRKLFVLIPLSKARLFILYYCWIIIQCRGLRILQLCNIYVILGYLERFNGIAVTVSSYKLSGCTYVEYGKTADSL